MALTGGWMRSVSQGAADFESAPADPDHGVKVGTTGKEWTWRAPAQPTPVTDVVIPGTEYVDGLPGQIINFSSSDPADGATPSPRSSVGGQLGAEQADQGATLAAEQGGQLHAVDRGAAKAAFFHEKGLYKSDERFGLDDFPGITSTVPGVPWVGKNGAPEANPDGYTPGRFRRWWATSVLRATQAASAPKRFPMMWSLGDATGIVNNIPANGSPTGTPFDQLYRPITNYFSRPMIRASAQPWDELVTVDGTDEIYAEPLGSYGVY